MKVVYIAGPFRADTPFEIAENVRRAERWGLAVAQAGYMPLIPHANTALFHGQCTEKFWIEGTMELLRRCDAVVVTPGFEGSSGTKGEIIEAARLKIPVVMMDQGDPEGGLTREHLCRELQRLLETT